MDFSYVPLVSEDSVCFEGRPCVLEFGSFSVVLLKPLFGLPWCRTAPAALGLLIISHEIANYVSAVVQCTVTVQCSRRVVEWSEVGEYTPVILVLLYAHF